jgi:hypothetical protein
MRRLRILKEVELKKIISLLLCKKLVSKNCGMEIFMLFFRFWIKLSKRRRKTDCKEMIR